MVGSSERTLGPDDPIPAGARRVLVAGTSGAGKTTLARRVASAVGAPHIEIDGLYHGPGWVPRPEFERDVDEFSAAESWVTEWQYGSVRPLLASRADLLIWLDLPRRIVMAQVVRRTLRRRLRRERLWNGNVEPPLHTILRDPEHIVRWAWSSHQRTAGRIRAAIDEYPRLAVIRLRSRRDVARFRDRLVQSHIV